MKLYQPKRIDLMLFSERKDNFLKYKINYFFTKKGFFLIVDYEMTQKKTKYRTIFKKKPLTKRKWFLNMIINYWL